MLLIAPMAGRALSDNTSSTPLGGYTMFANGNGVQVMLDNPGGLAGSHPIGYVSAPEASAIVETGPLGHGLATVVWPGAAVGNLGALQYQLPIPKQLQPILKNANDPVRAEANVPGGPADATFPQGGGGPIVMSSHADGKTVDSQASVIGFGTAGLIQVGTISGHGTTVLSDTSATSTGISAAAGVDILGGLLHIDSIKSKATASSDGATAKGAGNTVVSGVKVAGVEATIDNTGVHVAQSNTPLGGAIAPVNQLINQVLGALNFKSELLRTTNSPNGAQNNVTAGGLVISYNVPANISQLLSTVLHNIPQIPNVWTDSTVTITLAGATADVDASPGFAFGPDPGAGGTPGAASNTGTGSPGVAGSSTPGSSSIASAPQLAQSATRRSSGTGPNRPQTLSSSPIGFFNGLDPGLIVLALIGAVLTAIGMKRLCAGVLEPTAGSVCPLKESS
jgi:hypothetical protein